MNCPHCGNKHPDNIRFCPNTGKQIDNASINCPNCGQSIPNEASFCPFCGYDGLKKFQSSNSDRRYIFLIISGICIIIILAFIFLKKDKLNSSSNSTDKSTQKGQVSETVHSKNPSVQTSPTSNKKPKATITVTKTVRPTPTEDKESDDGPWDACPNTYESRLHEGDRAYVSFDPPLSNRVRSKPSRKASVVGMIEPGEKMKIVDGPSCADDWVWWKITSEESGLTGWTSEGDYEGYWLVPVP